MSTISEFEDIDAWKKARTLTRQIREITSSKEFSRDYSLKDQLRRASVSIMSNIAEGFERDGNKEFIQFLSHAKGSAGEIRSQLYVALDDKLITEQQFRILQSRTKEVSKMIGGFIGYLKASELKGSKFVRMPTRNLEP
jgi:four helix bundle protein